MYQFKPELFAPLSELPMIKTSIHQLCSQVGTFQSKQAQTDKKQLFNDQLFNYQQLFVKLRSKFSKLGQMEVRLKNADLQDPTLTQTVVHLTNQFQPQTAWGLLSYKISQAAAENNMLWLMRNTCLMGTEQFYLVVFCGNYEVKTFV